MAASGLDRNYLLSATVQTTVRRRKKGLAARFWTKVEQCAPDACWPWKGKCKRNGYGQITADPEGNMPRGRKLYAHRVAYELAFGPIPLGLHVLHRCDNPRCVNPGHLFLGTHRDNMADMIAKRRHAHGERQPTRKLNRNQVRAIRWLASHDPGRQIELAREFDVSGSTITHILMKKTWKIEQ